MREESLVQGHSAARADIHLAHPGADALGVDVETAPPALYVDLIGEVDIATRHHLSVLSSLPLTNVTMILLDLSQVDFCDSSGIRALIHLRHAQLDAGRHVWITRVTPRVRYLLEGMGVAPDFLQ